MKNHFLDSTVDPANVVAAFVDLIQKAAGPKGLIQKGPSGSPQGPYLHGPGGLFGVRGLSRDVVSTHTQITGSLAEMLPIEGNNEMNPLFPYITGFIRSDTQDKNAICDDPEEAGNMKTCIQTTVFGRKEFKTREFEIGANGSTINRGEFTDLRLVNDPLVDQMAGLMKSFYGMTDQSSVLAGREMTTRFVEVAVAFQRWLCPATFLGNPSNSSAGGGYKEFPGLDLLIGTNKIDALSGATCPSLYSDVKSFSFRTIDSTTDPDIYRTLSTMMYILEQRARTQNFGAVDFRIVMRSQLFWELCRYWPQKYLTDGATLSQAGLDNLYLETTRLRDDMRNGSYLIINAKKYGVILDDCLPEDNRSNNATIPIGGFASDIYIVPMTALGGSLQTLYWQYFDYKQSLTPDMGRLPLYFWSDNGIFMWTMNQPKLWCFDVAAKFQPRLILRTPQLAGRLTDVAYVPLQHVNDPLPSSAYHINGGVKTGRPFPSPYSEWNGAGPGSGA